MTDAINLSQINSDFTDNTEPKDEHLIELLKQAYKGEILCRMAIVNIALVKPFSDYKPTISEPFRKHFIERTKTALPPPVHVYEQDGKFIMSDDYNAYHLYLEHNLPEVVCVILGDATITEGVEYVGDPFVLPPPKVEAVK